MRLYCQLLEYQTISIFLYFLVFITSLYSMSFSIAVPISVSTAYSPGHITGFFEKPPNHFKDSPLSVVVLGVLVFQ